MKIGGQPSRFRLNYILYCIVLYCIVLLYCIFVQLTESNAIETATKVALSPCFFLAFFMELTMDDHHICRASVGFVASIALVDVFFGNG